jgi:hypothetical protein
MVKRAGQSLAVRHSDVQPRKDDPIGPRHRLVAQSDPRVQVRSTSTHTLAEPAFWHAYPAGQSAPEAHSRVQWARELPVVV